MAVQNPPYALQNSSHSAALFRQAITSNLFRLGVVGPTELAVTAQSTPNMSVQVGPGRTWVAGSQVAGIGGLGFSTQAGYFVLNDASVTLTVAAADPTHPRIDVVYAAVQDSQYSGASNTALLGIVTGTPASSPTVPSLPANAMPLEQISVAANATSITNSNLQGAAWSNVPTSQLFTCTSTTRPSPVWTGFTIFETDTLAVRTWDGSVWANANGAFTCTSTTRPTPVQTGFVIHETDTGNVSLWSGSAWLPFGDTTPASSVIPFGRRDGTATSQNMPNNTWTTIPLPTVSKNTGLTAITNGFTVITAGWYLCSGSIAWIIPSAGANRREAGIAVNGTIDAHSTNGYYATVANGLNTATSTIPIHLSAGDQVLLQGWNDSGGTDVVNPQASFLSMWFIST